MIELRKYGTRSFIEQASGPKATPKVLKIGGVYLYGGMFYKTRKIVDIHQGKVTYIDDISCQFGTVHECSDSHFCRKCPTEATQEEIEFLNEPYLN